MGRSLVTVHLKLASDCPKFIVGGQSDRPFSSSHEIYLNFFDIDTFTSFVIINPIHAWSLSIGL